MGIICCVALASFAVAASCPAAERVTSTQLLNDTRHYNEKDVSYQGEVVGEVMVRGEFAWINANDGVNAIGIWAPVKLARAITHTGSYQKRGDTIIVSGTFHRACRVHGGDLDIHAAELTVLTVGSGIRPALDIEKLRLMINLTIILFTVIIAAILARIRSSRAALR